MSKHSATGAIKDNNWGGCDLKVIIEWFLGGEGAKMSDMIFERSLTCQGIGLLVGAFD